MKFVRTLLATTALMTFFALSLPSFAQEQTQERDRMNAPPASITGCLTKAESGDQWILVTSVIEDPKYLTDQFLTSTHFKLEPTGSKWNPAPCHTDPPPVVKK